MEYGLEGGGFAGGLAEGLTNGLNIGQRFYDDAQNQRRQQQQDTERRQQQSFNNDVVSKQEARLNQAQKIDLQKIRLDAINQQLGAVNDELAGYSQAYQTMPPDQQAALNQDPQVQAAIQRKQALAQAQHDTYTRMIGPEVLGGVEQAQADAHALQLGQVTPDALPPVRLYNVLGLTGHKPIDFIDGHTQSDGPMTAGQSQPSTIAPIKQKLDAVVAHADAGNWGHAKNAMFHVVHPYLPHPDQQQSQPSASPGITYNAPYARDPNDPHGHIGQAVDVHGALSTLHAAVNSDPSVQQKILEAHVAGAGQHFDAARMALLQNGGIKGLAVKLATDPTQAMYQFLVTHGVSPAEAVNRIKADPLGVARFNAGINAPLHQSEIERNHAAAEASQARAEKTAAIKPPDDAVAERARKYADAHMGDYGDDGKPMTARQLEAKYYEFHGKTMPGSVAAKPDPGFAANQTGAPKDIKNAASDPNAVAIRKAVQSGSMSVDDGKKKLKALGYQ